MTACLYREATEGNNGGDRGVDRSTKTRRLSIREAVQSNYYRRRATEKEALGVVKLLLLEQLTV